MIHINYEHVTNNTPI